MQDQCPSNPFQALGLRPAFGISPDSIERAYLQRLAQAHPDAGGGVDDAKNSMDNAMDDDRIDAAGLNQARLTLLDAEKRANALLQVLKGPSASQSKALPDGFLMEMMTKRQEIEAQIDADGEQARASGEIWAIDQRRAYDQRAQALFEGLAQAPAENELIEIRTHLNAWRYIERFIEQLDPDYDPQGADFR